MHHRTALIVAIIAAGGAIGLVAADVVWNLELRVEARAEGGWKTIYDSRTDEAGFDHIGELDDCVTVGDEIRLTFDNNKPLSDTFDIRVRYYNGTSEADQDLFRDTWSLGPFDTRSETLAVPDDALGTRDGPGFMAKSGSLTVEYDRNKEGFYERNIPICLKEAA